MMETALITYRKSDLVDMHNLTTVQNSFRVLSNLGINTFKLDKC
jgi:hypothetical protein